MCCLLQMCSHIRHMVPGLLQAGPSSLDDITTGLQVMRKRMQWSGTVRL